MVASNQLKSRNRHAEQGFTLIELSIVLVIIGLIVGGVLVGQDLIKAAEIRATVSQIEKYNSAINTFRNKYNGIPGDLAGSQASAFGLYYFTTTMNSAGFGDGNGLIEGGGSGKEAFIGEPPMFFLHLSQANLIDGMYGAGGANVTLASATTSGGSGIANLSAGTTAATVMQVLPPAKLGRGNYITVGSTGGYNFFMIAGVSVISQAGAYSAANNYLTPLEAYNMDKKVDDGQPGSGSVQAADGSSTNIDNAASTTANAFINAGQTSGTGFPIAGCAASQSAYAVSGTLGTTQACSLRWRFY